MTLDERISRYLDKCEPAISGSDGHGTTFKVACALVNGFALNAEAALAHLTAYNTKCCPPWKPRELRHKVQQAEKTAHTKPRGHLLGADGRTRAEAVQWAAKPVPVRLTPKKDRFRTLRTLLFDPTDNVRARTHSILGGDFRSSEASVIESASPIVQPTGPQPSEPSVAESPSVQQIPPEEDGLVWIPGCKVPRPVEIEVDDDTWRAVEAAGFADEPLIQHALWLFPGSTAVESGVAR